MQKGSERPLSFENRHRTYRDPPDWDGTGVGVGWGSGNMYDEGGRSIHTQQEVKNQVIRNASSEFKVTESL